MDRGGKRDKVKKGQKKNKEKTSESIRGMVCLH